MIIGGVLLNLDVVEKVIAEISSILTCKDTFFQFQDIHGIAYVIKIGSIEMIRWSESYEVEQ